MWSCDPSAPSILDFEFEVRTNVAARPVTFSCVPLDLGFLLQDPHSNRTDVSCRLGVLFDLASRFFCRDGIEGRVFRDNRHARSPGDRRRLQSNVGQRGAGFNYGSDDCHFHQTAALSRSVSFRDLAALRSTVSEP